MQTYLNQARRTLIEGNSRLCRTGDETISLFGAHYIHHLRDGFPLLTTKKMSWKNIVVENLWFLAGRADVAALHQHGVHFWDAWADEDGQIPSQYGPTWRNFHGVDQLEMCLYQLKSDTFTRRAVVSAWDPTRAFYQVLPPCHMLFVFNAQPKGPKDADIELNLHLTQRSCDLAIGLPYNLAGYGLILSIFAQLLRYKPGIFSHSIADLHLYNGAKVDHMAGITEQLTRTPRPLPTLELDPSLVNLEDFTALLDGPTDVMLEKIKLVNYNPHPAIKFDVAV